MSAQEHLKWARRARTAGLGVGTCAAVIVVMLLRHEDSATAYFLAVAAFCLGAIVMLNYSFTRLIILKAELADLAEVVQRLNAKNFPK